MFLKCLAKTTSFQHSGQPGAGGGVNGFVVFHLYSFRYAELSHLFPPYHHVPVHAHEYRGEMGVGGKITQIVGSNPAGAGVALQVEKGVVVIGLQAFDAVHTHFFVHPVFMKSIIAAHDLLC